MEYKIVKFFNRLDLALINRLADSLSRLRFLFIFWIVLIVGFVFLDQEVGRKIFITVFVAMTLHFLITEGLIKHLLTKIWGIRLRPYIKHPEINPFGRKFKDSSFPSSHMATTVAILLIMALAHPILWPFAIVLILLMAYARLYQGMHYPSDILVGVILGIAYGWSGIWIIEQILR